MKKIKTLLVVALLTLTLGTTVFAAAAPQVTDPFSMFEDTGVTEDTATPPVPELEDEGKVDNKPNEVHNAAETNINNNLPKKTASSGPALNLLIALSLGAGYLVTRKEKKA